MRIICPHDFADAKFNFNKLLTGQTRDEGKMETHDHDG